MCALTVRDNWGGTDVISFYHCQNVISKVHAQKGERQSGSLRRAEVRAHIQLLFRSAESTARLDCALRGRCPSFARCPSADFVSIERRSARSTYCYTPRNRVKVL